MNHSEAERLARTLIAEHCPEVPFGWDNARRRMGCAHFVSTKMGGRRIGTARAVKITLSRPLVAAATEAEVFNTITHEIAHVKAGFEAGHGPLWRSIDLALGGNGSRTHDVETEAVAPFMFDCPCGVTHKWYKRSKNMHRKLCNHCRTKIVWMTGAEYRRAKRVSA